MAAYDPETLAARRAQARRRRVGRRRLGHISLGVSVVIGVLIAFVGGGGHTPTRSGRNHVGRVSPGSAKRGLGSLTSLKAPGQAEQQLMAMGRPVYCGGHRGRYVALTFDDGPGPYTHLALEELRAAHVRATFFLVGRNLAHHRDLLVRELTLGALGDHTYTHPYLPALPAASVTGELARTQDEITALTGQRPELFRPPFGARSSAIDRQAQHRGMIEVLWNVDSADALGAEKNRIATNVIAGLQPGSIILMHENRGQTIVALRRRILPTLRRRHLQAVTVPELLTLDPPLPAQLRAGGRGCRVHSSSKPTA